MNTNWVVMKFGGTSVSTLKNWQNIINVIKDYQKETPKIFIVCSAISGVSNLLESFIENSFKGSQDAILDQIKNKHIQFAKELGISVPSGVVEFFDKLEQLGKGINLSEEASPKIKALILSMGELMLTKLIMPFLLENKTNAYWMDARENLIVDNFDSNNNHLLRGKWDQDKPEEDFINKCNAIIADNHDCIITQGFIAKDRLNQNCILGRGGSDVSASYFAVKLSASRCEIWTDVPGLFSADPRLIPASRLLRKLNYEEAQEIASTGAKVLHPGSIPPLHKHLIPLTIRYTPNPDIMGTEIRSDLSTESEAVVKAISIKKGIVLISMENLTMWKHPGFLADIFSCFKNHGISIDLISTSESNVTVTLDPIQSFGTTLANSLLDELKTDLGKICETKIISNTCAISLVGNKIRNILSEIGPLLNAFKEQKIHLVSQAANDLNLTFVVDQESSEKIIRELHFHLFQKNAMNRDIFGPSYDELFKENGHKDHEKILNFKKERPWWFLKKDTLLSLAKTSSPLFVYDKETIVKNITQLKTLTNISRIFYAMKANWHKEILTTIYNENVGIECVSIEEIKYVLDLFPTIDRKRILFTPNFASKHEYIYALNEKIWVTIDALYPLQMWGEIFENKAIILRLDPGHGQGHHQYVKTAGEQSKFGISLNELDPIKEICLKRNITVVGLHAHIGSGILNNNNWADIALFLGKLSIDFPSTKFLNLGGGLGVPDTSRKAPLNFTQINDSLKQIKQIYPNLEFWLEPGRFIIAKAGVLLSEVTQLKTKGTSQFIGINAGMNSLIRPALYGAYHDIVNLSRIDQPLVLKANIVGPICESGDTLGFARKLPKTLEGDIVLIDTAGAYGRSMSSSYNLRSPAPEKLI